jgi:effector-binding domain-containing protein
MQMVNQILVWLIEMGLAISDLPVVIINNNRSFEVCVPIKEAKIQETKEYKIKQLPAHRMGCIFHRESAKPLSLSEDFLKKQLQYDGFKILEPHRYVLHPNPEKPEIPLIEIQIPVHK